ncbi:MAG: tRNA-dihydrouridine synthase family protein [Phycisphaerales bacterium]|nr:tRNA-dihydrouridine synthase family protein [Phycisphaerales bacterium]
MSCDSNNATEPSPGIAPGSDTIDPRRVAEMLARAPGGGIPEHIRRLMPAFDAPFYQAGLAGYSDPAMRIIARRHGCPMCVTEALLDRTLLAGGRGFAKADLGDLHDNIPGGHEDHPLVGQIMGSDPREMAAAALKMLEQRARSDSEYRRLAYADGVTPPGPLRLPGGEQIRATTDDSPTDAPAMPPGVSMRGGFEGIDVNLACPVKKIEKKARGGHWLSEPEGAIEILQAVREVVPKDVACSVKLRRSFDETPEMVESLDTILDATRAMGYDWATVHARTVVQKYVGPSRWDLLRDLVARHPDMTIFGSGDIWNAADIFRMIAYTGVKAVSVARGCIGNPWIFRQARDLMAGRDPAPPTLEEQRQVLEAHFVLLMAVCGSMRQPEEMASRHIRKFGIRFSAHHPDAERVRRRVIEVQTHAHWTALLDECYATPEIARG